MPKRFHGFSSIPVALTVFYCISSVTHGDRSNEDNRALEIESTTRVASAQCVLNGGNESDDKKRTTVGIGEVIDLELIGKLINDVDPETIRWSIIQGNNLATIEQATEDKQMAVLTINKNVTTQATICVQVTTNIELDPQIREFNIIIPTDIQGKHSGLRHPECPQDGEKDKPGASSLLTLTFLPLNVSFSNIAIKERGEDPEGFTPPHDPGNRLFRPNARNESSHDSIGWKFLPNISLQNLQNLQYPHSFSWTCGWYVRANDMDCCKIHGEPYLQQFRFSYDGRETENEATKGLQNIKISITKFGCSVIRSTAGNAIHHNN